LCLPFGRYRQLQHPSCDGCVIVERIAFGDRGVAVYLAAVHPPVGGRSTVSWGVARDAALAVASYGQRGLAVAG